MPRNSDGDLNSEVDGDLSSQSGTLLSKLKSFGFEEFLNRNKIALSVAFFGLILLGFGVFLYKNTDVFNKSSVEVVNEPGKTPDVASNVVVEIAGSVQKPGVYKLPSGSRVEDLMSICGGLSLVADRSWVEKYINRAAKLTDGLKIYIKSVDETVDSDAVKQTMPTSANASEQYQSVSPVLEVDSSSLVNINTAPFSELDNLP